MISICATIITNVTFYYGGLH